VLQLHCHMAADCRHHASHHAEIARPQTAATISGEW
jgi:hypothetical protein